MAKKIKSMLDLSGVTQFMDFRHRIPHYRHLEAIKVIVRDNPTVDVKTIANELFRLQRELFYDPDKTTKKWDYDAEEFKDKIAPFNLRAKYSYRWDPQAMYNLIGSFKSEFIEFKELRAKFGHSSDSVAFLKACKRLFPNADPMFIGQAATSLRCFIQNIWYNIDNTICRQTGTVLYLYSDTDHTGKRSFLTAFQQFCKTQGIPFLENFSPESPLYTSEFSEKLVAFRGYAHPFKYREGKTALSILANNDRYPVKTYWFKPMLFKSICSFALSNYVLPEPGSQGRFGLVVYNEYPIGGDRTLPEEIITLQNSDYSMEDAFLDVFRHCPFDRVFIDLEDPVIEYLTSFKRSKNVLQGTALTWDYLIDTEKKKSCKQK